jgi:hypothetical protein
MAILNRFNWELTSNGYLQLDIMRGLPRNSYPLQDYLISTKEWLSSSAHDQEATKILLSPTGLHKCYQDMAIINWI